MNLRFATFPSAAFLSVALTLAGSVRAETVSPDVLDRLAQSAYVTEGAAQPRQVVYAFSDPNCPYCDLMWRALQPYEQEGLQVRWVEVAVLAPSSAGKAATLLESPDGDVAMKANEEHFDFANSAGAVMPMAATPVIRAALDRNLKLMQDLRLFGTPALVFRNRSGDVVVKAGMPRLSSLGGMFGLPAVSVQDPLLERFR